MPAETDPTLPRFQQGPRSQQLLTVLLGDYWYGRSDPVPSAALVELLEVFGVSASGARAAIQRLTQRGFFVGTRIGRQTAYAVPPMSQEKTNRHVRRLFLGHLPPEWDGTWTLATYSVPEDANQIRRALREQLRELRFGNLYDAVWIRPGDHAGELSDLVDGLHPQLRADQLTAFTGARLPAGTGRRAVSAAFGLDAVARDYRAFVRRWSAVAEQMRSGPDTVLRGRPDGVAPGDEALRLRTSIMTDWRRLRHRDPLLPHELLGEDFPLHAAVSVCSVVYDGLGEAAEAAVRRILRPHGDGLAQLATHHTFAASRSLLA